MKSAAKRLARALLPRMALATLATLLLTLVLELLLRSVPALVPAGAFYGSGRWEPAIGLYVHDSPVLYNKVRALVRKPNRAGFMDVDHREENTPRTPKAKNLPPGHGPSDQAEKEPGSRQPFRVGIFGDSYVEAMQVPLQDTFFRRLPKKLAGRELEVLAFGISGWGTVDSLVNYRHQADRYGLDLVIHLFVKNDPGDNSHTLQSRRRGIFTPTHTAALDDSPAGFRIQRAPEPRQDRPSRRLARWMKNHSLLARILHARLQLIFRRPSGATPPSGDKEQTFQDQEALPSHWPPDLLREAKALTRNLLRAWQLEATNAGRPLWILYVPRGSEELRGNLAPGDPWFPWLDQVCREFDIPLLDPRGPLLTMQTSGSPVYDDHWSPAGHAVIAEVLATSLREHLRTIP